PSVGANRPAAISISVLLPQPDGPISDTNSPPRIEKDTSSIAVNTVRLPAKRLVMWRPSMGAPLDTLLGAAAVAVVMRSTFRRIGGQVVVRVVIGDRLAGGQIEVFRQQRIRRLPVLIRHAAHRGRARRAHELEIDLELLLDLLLRRRGELLHDRFGRG